MSNTRPDIVIPRGVALDLYAELNSQSGFPPVTVGDRLLIVNKSSLPVYLQSQATAPTSLRNGLPVTYGQQATNSLGDLGAFVSSPVRDGLITVSVVEIV